MDEPQKLTAAEVHGLLRLRFGPPEWHFFDGFTVADHTNSFRAARIADGVAMNLWPSRDYEVDGFEIKVSRADWLRELRDPSKSDTVSRYCDRWWIVVPDESIVARQELPAGWGLLVVRGRTKLRVSTQAPKRDAAPMDRALISQLLRAAPAAIAPDEIGAAYRKGRAEGVVAGRAEAEVAIAGTDVGRLRALVSDFEAASGVNLRAYYDGRALGEAVAYVMRGGLEADLGKIYEAAAAAQAVLRAAAPVLEGFAPKRDSWSVLQRPLDLSPYLGEKTPSAGE